MAKKLKTATKKLKITYQSNYNGADVEGDLTDRQKEKLTDTIIDHAIDECNDEGEFYGDIDELEEFVRKTVAKQLGADYEVEFEEDSLST